MVLLQLLTHFTLLNIYIILKYLFTKKPLNCLFKDFLKVFISLVVFYLIYQYIFSELIIKNSLLLILISKHLYLNNHI